MSREDLAARLSAMAEAGRAMASALVPADLAATLASTSLRLLDAHAVGVLTFTEDGEHLELLAFEGPYAGWTPGLRLPLSAELNAAAAVRERRCVRRDEAPVELAVPLLAGERIVGAVDVQRQSSTPFDQQEQALLSSLCGTGAVAMADLRARVQLEDERRRTKAILECSADGIVTTDQGGRITFFSPGAEALFGWKEAEVLGRHVKEYYLEGTKEARRVQRHLEETGQVRNLEVWFRTADDKRVPASLSASVLRDEHDNLLGSLGVLKDITNEKKLERKLSHTIDMLQEANENLGRLAMTDSLSGLKNQRYFHRKLGEELLRSARTGRPVSLLLVDIDQFKRFNDDHGHQVGDRVIQEMGATVLESIRKIDHGCRYGGEEFTVVLPETDAGKALVVARRLQAGFRDRSAWKELSLEPPTLSIGLAECVVSQTDAVDTETLIRAADEAMYAVKRRGGDGIEQA